MEASSLDPKLAQLLAKIVERYIDSAQPVSSGALVDAYRLSISSATARNYMAELEEAGLVVQPHTSAGRIPTEQGYALYVSQLKPSRISATDAKALDVVWNEAAEQAAFEARFKSLAKELAGRADEAVFVAFGKNDTYYTGLAHLFAKPDLDQDHVQKLSMAIDQLDTVLTQVFDAVPDQPTIWLGGNNPFSAQCGTVLTRYEHGGIQGVIGIIGPMRMRYDKNLALVDHVAQLLQSPKE